MSVEWSKPYAVDINPVLSGIEYQKEIASNVRELQKDLNSSHPNKKMTYEIMNKIVLDEPALFASRSKSRSYREKEKEAIKAALPLRLKYSNNEQGSESSESALGKSDISLGEIRTDFHNTTQSSEKDLRLKKEPSISDKSTSERLPNSTINLKKDMKSLSQSSQEKEIEDWSINVSSAKNSNDRLKSSTSYDIQSDDIPLQYLSEKESDPVDYQSEGSRVESLSRRRNSESERSQLSRLSRSSRTSSEIGISLYLKESNISPADPSDPMSIVSQKSSNIDEVEDRRSAGESDKNYEVSVQSKENVNDPDWDQRSKEGDLSWSIEEHNWRNSNDLETNPVNDQADELTSKILENTSDDGSNSDLVINLEEEEVEMEIKGAAHESDGASTDFGINSEIPGLDTEYSSDGASTDPGLILNPAQQEIPTSSAAELENYQEISPRDSVHEISQRENQDGSEKSENKGGNSVEIEVKEENLQKDLDLTGPEEIKFDSISENLELDQSFKESHPSKSDWELSDSAKSQSSLQSLYGNHTTKIIDQSMKSLSSIDIPRMGSVEVDHETSKKDSSRLSSLVPSEKSFDLDIASMELEEIKEPLKNGDCIETELSESMSMEIPEDIVLDSSEKDLCTDIIPNEFKITIKKLILDLDNSTVQNLRNTNRQIFVAYTFLDISPDELESSSMIPSSTGVHAIDFSKSIVYLRPL